MKTPIEPLVARILLSICVFAFVMDYASGQLSDSASSPQQTTIRIFLQLGTGGCDRLEFETRRFRPNVI
jgi:hypothetical protein